MQRDLIDSLMMANGDKFVEKSRYQGRGEFGQTRLAAALSGQFEGTHLR